MIFISIFLFFVYEFLNLFKTILNLVSLVPLVIPIPLILLGLFTSGIQALIFATLSGSLRIIIKNIFQSRFSWKTLKKVI
jgi:hypothetical protein